MTNSAPSGEPVAPGLCARTLSRALARYREPNPWRSAVEIVITAGPLAALWAAIAAAIAFGHVWLGVALIAPAAAFLVRLFMIQHDCGHGSLFRNRRLNDWVGRVISVLTLTPYDYWRRTHAAHHAGSGNLDRRGMGEVGTLTVNEYLALSRWHRLRYRLYRHPLVMFGIGPAYLFLVQNRIPVGMLRGGWRPWLSTMATNVALGALAGGAIWLLGLGSFLLAYLPVVLLAASIGVWLFYVQHQFEHSLWVPGATWNAQDAALRGSSHYDLPAIMRWLTANIGIHHVHHLASRIPYYRLGRVLRDNPELRRVSRLTLLQSLNCVGLALWCEARRRLVRFRDLPAPGLVAVAANPGGTP